MSEKEPKKKRSLKRKIAIGVGFFFLTVIIILGGLFTFFLLFVYPDIEDGTLVDKRDPKYLTPPKSEPHPLDGLTEQEYQQYRTLRESCDNLKWQATTQSIGAMVYGKCMENINNIYESKAERNRNQTND